MTAGGWRDGDETGTRKAKRRPYREEEGRGRIGKGEGKRTRGRGDEGKAGDIGKRRIIYIGERMESSNVIKEAWFTLRGATVEILA